MNMKKIVKSLFKLFGLNITKIKEETYPIDLSQSFIKDYKSIEPYTVTSIERIYALKESVKYIINNRIEGDFVECGVWKGGSCMMMAKTLVKNHINNKKIWLYDTFDGMTMPTEDDMDVITKKAGEALINNMPKNTDKYNIWAYAPIDIVKKNMESTNYPEENVKYIAGKVEETLASIKPESISLLRLDTDWYESTKYEMEILYPLLSIGGILIIDDYGHFTGAKKAIDEYFKENQIDPMMNRIDYTGRLIIKR